MPNNLVDELTLTIGSIDIERVNQFNILGLTLIFRFLIYLYINYINKSIDRNMDKPRVDFVVGNFSYVMQ